VFFLHKNAIKNTPKKGVSAKKSPPCKNGIEPPANALPIRGGGGGCAWIFNFVYYNVYYNKKNYTQDFFIKNKLTVSV